MSELIIKMRAVLELHVDTFRNARSQSLRETAKEDYENCASAYNQLLYFQYGVKKMTFPSSVYLYEMDSEESK